jgi:hypothetical protein
MLLKYQAAAGAKLKSMVGCGTEAGQRMEYLLHRLLTPQAAGFLRGGSPDFASFGP